jgi:hypothetical protein
MRHRVVVMYGRTGRAAFTPMAGKSGELSSIVFQPLWGRSGPDKASPCGWFAPVMKLALITAPEEESYWPTVLPP